MVSDLRKSMSREVSLTLKERHRNIWKTQMEWVEGMETR